MRQWTEQQQRVIDSPSAKIICAAAAGSGKTAVMIERAVRLLRDNGLKLYGAALSKAAQDVRSIDLRGAAVAVGANARATSRTTNYQLPTTNTPGEMPACSKCPHLKKLKKLEALLSK